MKLITGISIQNFKCYRRKQDFDLNQSNFFIGTNNAGKSAVLKALQCFFDDEEYYSDFINKTELRAKGAGANKSVIGITFNINAITTKTLSSRIKAVLGEKVTLFKNFTYRETLDFIYVDYTLNGKTMSYEYLPDELTDLISKISVSYIHPQEANELLEKAQEKLKSRLLNNWGRSSVLKETLTELQRQWSDLRTKANTYLSNGLTQSLQNIWPGCETTVGLPERIDEIIGVSDIMFKSSPEMPDVSLTSQGTGAQSTILYQTHFLLDSDKTLHRGFHYPIWLIEEPESFLHADIIFKLGYLLCSDTWLDNIQMLVSTHSPLLLATSKKNAENISWFTLDKHVLLKSNPVDKWTETEIKEIGILMGDPNFDIYFKTSQLEKLVIIEDSKQLTETKFKESGIPVTQRLNGVTEMKRYFDVLRAIDISMGRNIYLIVDNDDGIKDFRNSLASGKLIETTTNGFAKYQFEHNVYLIVFPDNYAVEELFEEHDKIVESCANQIFNSDYTKAISGETIPANLSRAHAAIRNKETKGIEEAKKLIRNQQDVKDIFWAEVENNNLNFSKIYAEELKSLIL